MGGFKPVKEINNVVELYEGLVITGHLGRVFDHTLKSGDNVKVYEIQPEEGEPCQLIGCGSLNYQMASCQVGDLLQIKYNGKKDMPNPKSGEVTSGHDFTVARWED